MRDRLGRLVVAAAALAVSYWMAAGQALACAGCRNPGIPVTRLQTIRLTPGQVQASLILGLTRVHVVHEAGCADLANCDAIPTQPLHLHDQAMLPAELRPVVAIGVRGGFAAEVHMPFRVVRTSIDYTTPAGMPFQPLDPDVHHRNETLGGIGDPWLLALSSHASGLWNVNVRGGLSIPLGRTEEDPFALGDAGVRHQHIQFGNGTIDPVFGLEVTRALPVLQVTIHAIGQASLYENHNGFRAGPNLQTGVQVGRRVLRTLTGALGVDVIHVGADRWQGKIRQDGNLGRTDVMLGITLVQDLGPITLGLMLRFPVFRHIVVGDEPPGTLSAPVMLSLFASRTF